MKFEFEIELPYCKIVKVTYTENNFRDQQIITSFGGDTEDFPLYAKKLSAIAKMLQVWRYVRTVYWRDVKKLKLSGIPPGDKFFVLKNKKVQEFTSYFFLDTTANIVRRFDHSLNDSRNSVCHLETFYSERQASDAVRTYIARALIAKQVYSHDSAFKATIHRDTFAAKEPVWNFENWNARGVSTATKVGIL